MSLSKANGVVENAARVDVITADPVEMVTFEEREKQLDATIQGLPDAAAILSYED